MINSVKLIELPKVLDKRGNLSFFQQKTQLPFDIARVYWIYDVPGGEKRGGHAYKELYELIVALSGSFDILVDDGTSKKKFTLNRSYYGLLVPKMVWRQLENFSTNSLCLIAASLPFDENDYIKDYAEFQKLLNE